MRIRQIQVCNFIGVEAFDSGVLDGGVFLTGRNGSGKTTVLDAVRYALLGYCNRTDKGGKGARALISSRSDAPAVITIETDAGLIETSIRPDQPVAWCAKRPSDGTSIAANRDTFLGYARCNKVALEIAINPSAYTSTSGLASVLSARASGPIDRAALRILCGEYLPWLEAEYPKLVRTLSGLREIGTLAYGQRRETGKQIAELEAKLKAAPQHELPKAPDGRVLTTGDIPAIDRSVEELSARLERLKRELWDAERFAGALPEGATLDGLAETAAEAQDAAVVADCAYKAAVDRFTGLSQALAKEESVIASIEASLEELGASINGGGEESVCPTCGQRLSAKAGKTAVARLRAQRLELTGALKGRKSERDRIAGECESIKAELENAKTAALVAQAKANEAARLYNLAKEAVGERRGVEAIQAEVDNVQKRLSSAKAALEALHEIHFTVDVVKAALEHAEERHRRLDWAVKAFLGGTVISQLLGRAFGDFNERVGDVVGKLGYVFQVGLDDKGGVVCSFGRRGEALRPLELASTGERKAVEVAIALAYGRETGIALIDDLDDLDGTNRNAVLKLISDVVQTGKVQVFAAGAWGKPSEPDAAALGQLSRALPGLLPLAMRGLTEVQNVA